MFRIIAILAEQLTIRIVLLGPNNRLNTLYSYKKIQIHSPKQSELLSETFKDLKNFDLLYLMIIIQLYMSFDLLHLTKIIQC